MLKYQAWGFIRANREPEYFALYVGTPQSKILYFGEAEHLTPPLTTRAELSGMTEEDLSGFSPGKRVLWLNKGSIRKLADPIVAGGSIGSPPQNPRYTTLRAFVEATNTGDLWGK